MMSKQKAFGLVLGLLVPAAFLFVSHDDERPHTVSVSDAAAIELNPITMKPNFGPVPIVNNQLAVPMTAVAHLPAQNTTPSCPSADLGEMSCEPPYSSSVSYDVWNSSKLKPPNYSLANWGQLGTCNEQFSSPVSAVVYDSRLYVVDRNNHRVKVSTLEGKTKCTFGRFGTEPGNFNLPSGIAEYDGRIYVADTANHRVQCFTPDGDLVGVCNLPVIAPVGITFDRATGVMYLTDASIHCVTSLAPIPPVKTRHKNGREFAAINH